MTDGTCELIGKCHLSQSLYRQEGAGFIPAVDKAIREWFSRLQLPPGAMPACSSSAVLQEWKKIKRIDSEAGDLMCAGAHCSKRDSRDSVHVRVSFMMLFTLIGLSPTTTQYEVADISGGIVTHYGKLQHILTIALSDSCKSLQPMGPTDSIFALIHRCDLKQDDPQLAGLDIHFFSKERITFDVIDITGVRCLVGRVKAGGNNWAIIDRSGKLARAGYEEPSDEES